MSLACIAVLAPAGARAALTIEITRGLDTGIPVAIAPFQYEGAGAPPQKIADIVQDDLRRSGRFNPRPRADFPTQPGDEVAPQALEAWQPLKVEALVVGRVKLLLNGKYQVQFRLYDVFKKTQLTGFRYEVPAAKLRATAHEIADVVYEKLTGEPGAFNTSIAYVTRQNGAGGKTLYKLVVADSDGHNPEDIYISPEPLLSPAWSPDGKRLAYVAFDDKRARVYVQGRSDRARKLVGEFKGVNSAPAWSPDGRRLALRLSQDGNPDIFVLDLETRALKRLTNDPAIDTEPAWSPDGRYLVFTSDRSGSPQIYRMPSDGGAAERLTFEGEYNARASYSPDGKMIAMISGHQRRYHIATLRLDGLALQVLTDAPLDESPSFAPNGRMILYASEERGRSVLASVSVDGNTRQVYREAGDVYEPAWSPYNRELKYKE